jgi:hypothetical protein
MYSGMHRAIGLIARNPIEGTNQMTNLNVMSVGAFKSHMTSLSGFGRAVDVGLVGALYSAAMHVELHGNTECMSVLLRKTPRVYAEGMRVAVAAMFAGSLVVTSAGNMSFVRGNAIALSDRIAALAYCVERNQGATSRSMTALVAGWAAENKAVAVAAKCDDVAGSTSDEGEGTGNVSGSVGRKAGKGDRPWVLTDKLGAFLDSASKHGCSASDVQTALAAIVGNMKAAIVQLEAKAREAKEGAVIEAFAAPVAGEPDFIGPVLVVAPIEALQAKAKRGRVGAKRTAQAVKRAA